MNVKAIHKPVLLDRKVHIQRGVPRSFLGIVASLDYLDSLSGCLFLS